MNPNMDPDDRAGRLLDRAISDLPARRAPKSLEQRVMAALDERRTLPWWRRGFAEWPVTARTGFISICIALVGFTLIGHPWMAARAQMLDNALSFAAAWTHPARIVLESAAGMLSLVADGVVGSISPVWEYVLLSATAVLYAVLVGVGTTAYRSIYRQTANAAKSASAGQS